MDFVSWLNLEVVQDSSITVLYLFYYVTILCPRKLPADRDRQMCE